MKEIYLVSCIIALISIIIEMKYFGNYENTDFANRRYFKIVLSLIIIFIIFCPVLNIMNSILVTRVILINKIK